MFMFMVIHAYESWKIIMDYNMISMNENMNIDEYTCMCDASSVLGSWFKSKPKGNCKYFDPL